MKGFKEISFRTLSDQYVKSKLVKRQEGVGIECVFMFLTAGLVRFFSFWGAAEGVVVLRCWVWFASVMLDRKVVLSYEIPHFIQLLLFSQQYN